MEELQREPWYDINGIEVPFMKLSRNYCSNHVWNGGKLFCVPLL